MRCLLFNFNAWYIFLCVAIGILGCLFQALVFKVTLILFLPSIKIFCFFYIQDGFFFLFFSMHCSVFNERMDRC